MGVVNYDIESNRASPLVEEFIDAKKSTRKLSLFKTKIHVADDIQIRLVQSDEEVIGDIDGKEGWVAIRGGPLAIGGLSLPVPDIIGQFLSWQKVPPISLTLNGYRILIGSMRLSDKLGIGLELKDIMGCYRYSYSSKSPCWAARSHLHLINGIPLSNKGYVADTLLFKGDWRNANSEFTLVDRLPRTWKSPPSLGKPDATKILALISYWREDKENPNLESRSSHVVLKYPAPSSCKPSKNRHIVWTLDEVKNALTGGNPKKEFYEGKEEEGVSKETVDGLSTEVVKGTSKEVVKGATKKVVKKGTKKVVSEDEEYVGSEDGVVSLSKEKTKKRSSVQSSTGSKRPKTSFSRSLVDEPDLEVAPSVTKMVGDTLDGISDVVVSFKGTAEGAPGIGVVDLDEVPSYDSLLAEMISDGGALTEGDRVIPSTLSHGKGKGPMLSPAARQAMVDRDMSMRESVD